MMILYKIERVCSILNSFVKHSLCKVNKKVLTKKLENKKINKINLSGGTQVIEGYFNIDICNSADLNLDLSWNDLPFVDNSIQVVVCMSAINYFSRHRAQEIVSECYRILKPNGIARFGVQDMEMIAKKYVEKDNDFFFQKLPNGNERFEGETLGDKFSAWFYGYAIKGFLCSSFYDYDSLAFMFKKSGFSVIERRKFLDSRLENIDQIDNRPEQMFYLEAVK